MFPQLNPEQQSRVAQEVMSFLLQEPRATTEAPSRKVNQSR